MITNNLVKNWHQLSNKIGRRFSSNFFVLGSDASFQKLKQTPGKKVLYFTASWCPPCKIIAPVFESLSKLSPNLMFLKIDVDSLSETAQDYRIQSVPTFVFLNDEKITSQFSGAAEALLKDNIAKLESE